MRALRSSVPLGSTALVLAAHLALASLGAVACADLDTASSGSSASTSPLGGAGQGGNPSTGGAAATGGDTLSASTSAGGSSTGVSGGAGGAGSASAGGAGGAVAQMAPDFSLVDLNPNSLSYQQPVSPRDYLTRVSAWYFGHST